MNPCRISASVLLLLCASGCASLPFQNRPSGGHYSAPSRPVVGRIWGAYAATTSVVIELSTIGASSPGPAGSELEARNPTTHEPTARLRTTTRRQGRFLSADILSGTPSPDDEVVPFP